MTCSRCQSTSVIIEPDEDGDLIEHCLACGHTRLVTKRKPTSKIKKVEEAERLKKEQEENARPTTIRDLAQKRAMRRYRKTALFRSTNRRIQQRYRRTPEGQTTLTNNRKRKSILSRLADRMEEPPVMCEKHGKKILVENNCITCLKEKLWPTT